MADQGTVVIARVRDALQRLGVPGIAALVLLLAALLLALVVTPRLEAGNRTTANEIAQLSPHPLEASSRTPAETSAGKRARSRYDPADPAAALLDQLPAADRFAPFVDALQAQATRRGVTIERTEYRLQPILGGRGLRTQMILPAHGNYPKIRAWLEAMLHDYPSASLQELALHRSGDGTADVDAHVVLAFYTRSAH